MPASDARGVWLSSVFLLLSVYSKAQGLSGSRWQVVRCVSVSEFVLRRLHSSALKL